MNTLFIPSRQRIRTSFALLGLLLLTGLAALSEARSRSEPNKPAALGTVPQWKLVAYTVEGKKTRITAKAPWISFKLGEVSGNSGVNTYGGSFIAKADGTFKVGGLKSTEMAGTPDRMRLEDSYMSIISKATTWSLNGNVLVLSDGTDRNKLTFKAVKGDKD